MKIFIFEYKRKDKRVSTAMFIISKHRHDTEMKMQFVLYKETMIAFLYMTLLMIFVIFISFRYDENVYRYINFRTHEI